MQQTDCEFQSDVVFKFGWGISHQFPASFSIETDFEHNLKVIQRISSSEKDNYLFMEWGSSCRVTTNVP
jgi:hypothetical protein